jgi:hypothetical protein
MSFSEADQDRTICQIIGEEITIMSKQFIGADSLLKSATEPLSERNVRDHHCLKHEK